MKYLLLEWVSFVDRDKKEFFGLKSTMSLCSDWTLAQDKVQKCPILIDLKKYADGRKDSEEGFISFWYREQGAFWKSKPDEFELRLDNENYLFMFDGLDKVNPDKYLDVINKIIHFSTQYSKHQIIVTSRISGYNSAKLQDAEFEHFTLKDFNESQIDKFVDRWAKILKKDSDKEEFKSRLSRTFEKSSTRNLARNPEMLMKIMIILNRCNYSLSDEDELYYLASKMYNNSEDKNWKDKEEILGLIAYKMQFESSSSDGNSIDDDTLKQLIYKYFKKKASQKQVNQGLELIEELYSDNFLSRSSSSNERNFAAPKKYPENVRAKALWYWSLPWKITKDHSETIDELKYYALHDKDDRVQCTAIQVLVKYYRTSKVGCEDEQKKCMQNWLKEIAFANKKTKSKAIIVELMTRYYCHDNITLKWLKETAFKSNEKQVRKAVVESITQYYQSTETLKWVEEIAFKDDNYEVRQVVTESIIQHYQSPETLRWVKEIALKDLNKSVKEKAVRSAGKYFIRENMILEWLKSLMSKLELQEVVIEVVVKYYAADDNTLKWLKDVFTKSKESKIRRKVLEEVSKYYDDAIFTWFRNEAIYCLLQSSEENEVEVQKLTSLIQPVSDNFKKNELNFNRLCKIANVSLSEDTTNVRLLENVFKALRYRYSDRPKTLEILQQAAAHRSSRVRTIAEDLLGELEGLPL
jgi:uncharacterized protein (UPF0147 family)